MKELSGTTWLWEAVSGGLELLFPNRCAGCGRLDSPPICTNCRSLLEWLDAGGGCIRCGEPADPNGGSPHKRCPRCREHPPLYTQAIAALRYVGPLTRAVPAWKYSGRTDLTRCFSELLIDWIAGKAPSWWEKLDSLVPAPHHPRTIRSRGFAPPEELAGPLGSAFSIPVLPRTLYKVRFTKPQVGLAYVERKMNLHDSMYVFDGDLVAGRTMLVVDDVMTTGATINECARALISAGAKRIYGLVLARQTDWSAG